MGGRARAAIAGWCGVAGAAIALEIVVRAGWISPLIVSPPSALPAAFGKLWEEGFIVRPFALTIGQAFAATTAAALVGMGAGGAAHRRFPGESAHGARRSRDRGRAVFAVARLGAPAVPARLHRVGALVHEPAAGALNALLLPLLLASAAVAFGAMVQGAVGFGMALVAAPLLVLIRPELVPGPLLVSGLALTLLVPLALTSTKRAVRRLGYVRWKRLHRLVYLAAVSGVVHFVWRVKADLREPLIFAGVLAVLLLLRLVPRRRRAPGDPAAFWPRPAGEL